MSPDAIPPPFAREGVVGVVSQQVTFHAMACNGQGCLQHHLNNVPLFAWPCCTHQLCMWGHVIYVVRMYEPLHAF